MEQRNDKQLLQIIEQKDYSHMKDGDSNDHEVLRMRHIDEVKSYYQFRESFKRKIEKITIDDCTVEGDSYDIEKDHFEEEMT